MARTRNKTTNPILYWKPNQFPSARFSDIQWDPTSVGNATEETEDNDSEGSTEESERIDYLKNRFRNDDSEGADCATGPSGCGTC